jgi:1,2-diacylglycerol 3-beta-glucosyltransferase
MTHTTQSRTSPGHPPDMEPWRPLDQSGGSRRLKAAIALSSLWGIVFIMHLWVWGGWLVLGFTLGTGAYLFNLLFARTTPLPEALPEALAETVTADLAQDMDQWPRVSILVAAKNEVAVITRLVKALANLNYPSERYDLWMIDDNSDDGTGEQLDQLVDQYPNVHVIHRDGNATGGKSGALNQVWPQTQGDVLVVFDADAQVPTDLLLQVVPLFQQQQVGAVQVRKEIANADTNFWTRGQAAEMAFDGYCQLKRIGQGGLGELRGNGQFVRRSALEQFGGWNEATITDDLDLTFRLHLTGWSIPVVFFPTVAEEGVTNAIALWHQRNRWAEGGYQRYLDYWQLLTPSRLGWRKLLDLLMFGVIQYGIPTMTVPDLALAMARNRLPMMMPVTSIALAFSAIGMLKGLRLSQTTSWLSRILHAVQGSIYMGHWLVVMATVTLRMAIRPKRLKWVKTDHGGRGDGPMVEVEAASAVPE